MSRFYGSLCIELYYFLLRQLAYPFPNSYVRSKSAKIGFAFRYNLPLSGSRFETEQDILFLKI